MHECREGERVLLPRADVAQPDALELPAQLRVRGLGAVLEDVGRDVGQVCLRRDANAGKIGGRGEDEGSTVAVRIQWPA